MPSSISSITSIASSSYTSSSEASSLLVHPPSPKLLLDATQEAATSILPHDPYSSTRPTEQASLPPLPPTPPPDLSRLSSRLPLLPPPVIQNRETVEKWRDNGPRAPLFSRLDDEEEELPHDHGQQPRASKLYAKQHEAEDGGDEDGTPPDEEQEALAGMLGLFDDDGQEAPAEMLELDDDRSAALAEMLELNGEAQEALEEILELLDDDRQAAHADMLELLDDDGQAAQAEMLELLDDEGQAAQAEMLELADEAEDGRDSVAEMAWSRAPDPEAINKGKEPSKGVNIDSSPVSDD